MKRLMTIFLAVGLLAMPAFAGAAQFTFDVVSGTGSIAAAEDGFGNYNIASIAGLQINMISALGWPVPNDPFLGNGDYVDDFSTLFLDYDGSSMTVSGGFSGVDGFTNEVLNYSGLLLFADAVQIGDGLQAFDFGRDSKNPDFQGLFGLDVFDPWFFQLQLDLIDDGAGNFTADGFLVNYSQKPDNFPPAVPEAGAATLFVSGLIGLTWFRRKKRFQD